MRIICLIILVFESIYSYSQQKDSISLQLFADAYVSFVPNKPYTNNRSGFHYNYTKTNTASVNLAMARIHYSTGRFRSNFGLMAGDYTKANLAAEEKWARNIYEANAGYKLSNQKELWFDVGVFPSHIGSETAIGKDNQTATRSITADNSPYYETGARLSYQANSKWNFSILALTGWQRITVPVNQKWPAWGTQITFTPSSNLTINSSTFLGNINRGTENKIRFYSNLYSTIKLNNKASLNLGWDIGVQETDTYSTNFIWNGLIAAFRYQLKPDKWSIAIRYERFIDKKNLLFTLPEDIYHEFNVHHTSANLDFQPLKNLLLRTEVNFQQSPFPIFRKGTKLASNQFSAFFICSYNFQYSK